MSVRQAFLALDSDHDGYITVEDLLRKFGDFADLNFNDLKKLVHAKASKCGKISYEDFSSWVGGVIQQSEGFYFRHDSVKNPGYDRCHLHAAEKEDAKTHVKKEMMKLKDLMH